MRQYTGYSAIIIVLVTTLTATAQNTTGIYRIGNSWTAQAFGFYDIAEAKGYPTKSGNFIVPSAPLDSLWKHKGFAFASPCRFDVCLLQDTWEYITLQPWYKSVDTNVAYADSFCQLAYQGREDATVFILACGPGNPEGKHNYTEAFEERNEGNFRFIRSRHYYESIVDSLRARFPDKRIGLIPLGHVMSAIHKHLKDGDTIAGVDSMADLYSDDNLHLNDKGKYVECVAHFIAIFQADPRGAIISGSRLKTVPADFAEDICEIAWEVFQEENSYYKLGGSTPEPDPESDWLKVADDSLRITNIFTSEKPKELYIPSVLQDGSQVYSDRILSLDTAGEFAGMAFIRTANQDRSICDDEWLSFDVDQNVAAYIAFRADAEVPAWLESWALTEKELHVDGALFKIYSKNFGKGTIVLGSACTSTNNYFVVLDGRGTSNVKLLSNNFRAIGPIAETKAAYYNLLGKRIGSSNSAGVIVRFAPDDTKPFLLLRNSSATELQQ